jgi:hypothetical protein
LKNGDVGMSILEAPGLTVEKNFGRTKLMKNSVPLLPRWMGDKILHFLGRDVALRRPGVAARRPYLGRFSPCARSVKGEALHEMAGETGGLDKSTHTHIEERRCGYEHFRSPWFNCREKLRENKAHEKFCSASSALGVRQNSSFPG